jgi:hypothetical protein
MIIDETEKKDQRNKGRAMAKDPSTLTAHFGFAKDLQGLGIINANANQISIAVTTPGG